MRGKANFASRLQCVLLLLVVARTAAADDVIYGGGTGESNDPYLIYTAEQMNAIGAEPNDWDKHFKLMANIDLSSYMGTDFNIIGYRIDWDDNKPFTGVFDGGGHTISNFIYTTTNAYHIGLFGYVMGAEIKDLGLIDPNIDVDTGENIGSLVGLLYAGNVSNCYADSASVTGDENVGGLVGKNDDWGTITNCNSSGDVLGNYIIGGLVGMNDYISTIINCYSSASVMGDDCVGGLVGHNDSVGRIVTCYSTGSVTGDDCVGGLVGNNDYGSTTFVCYSLGSVMGNYKVGGLVGKNQGTITNCYSVGKTTGTSDVGGFLGSSLFEGNVVACFWDTQTSGQSISAGGTGKTTAEMQDPNTFIDTGWNFIGVTDGHIDIWAEHPDGGYPLLWWQLPETQLPALPSFSGGTGKSNDPYLISTAEELNSIGHNLQLMTANFKLINDINLKGIDFLTIGTEAFPFMGVFDGNGHSIVNFCYTSTNTDSVGLFRRILGRTAQIKNLGLIDPNIDVGTMDYVGSLVGLLINATITNCNVQDGCVTGNEWIGGLVGYNSYGTITNCYATTSVSGGRNVGGLAGGNWGTIAGCYATVGVSGIQNVGGLIGVNLDTITNCYAKGNVSGEEGVGGLVGINDHAGATVTCYSLGSVIGDNNIGGLAGRNHGIIANCYSVGSIMGTTDVGGLVGLNDSGLVNACFWDIQTSGQATSDGGEGKATTEMQTISTFLNAGWDFVDETANGTQDIWWILEGQDYPRLWWELIQEGE